MAEKKNKSPDKEYPALKRLLANQGRALDESLIREIKELLTEEESQTADCSAEQQISSGYPISVRHQKYAPDNQGHRGQSGI